MTASLLPATETRTFAIPLPERLLTPNDRVHPLARARHNAAVVRHVSMLARLERTRLGVDTPMGLRRVHLTYVRPPREAAHPLDTDNLVACLKPARDALCISQRKGRGALRHHVDMAGWIVDDSPEWAEFTYSEEAGATRALAVSITEPR